jgi:VanZ family protein
MLRPLKRLNLKHYLLAPLVSIISSGLLEFIQHSLSVTRQSDLYDFLANSIGVFTAVLFFYLFVSGRKWEKLF